MPRVNACGNVRRCQSSPSAERRPNTLAQAIGTRSQRQAEPGPSLAAEELGLG
jgi:hypothetical protein